MAKKTVWDAFASTSSASMGEPFRMYYMETPTEYVRVEASVKQTDGSTRTIVVAEQHKGPYKTINIPADWLKNSDYAGSSDYSYVYMIFTVISSGGRDSAKILVNFDAGWGISNTSVYNNDPVSRSLGYYNPDASTLTFKGTAKATVPRNYYVTNIFVGGDNAPIMAYNNMSFGSGPIPFSYWYDETTGTPITNNNVVELGNPTTNDVMILLPSGLSNIPSNKIAKTPRNYNLSTKYDPSSGTTASITGTWGQSTDTVYAVKGTNFYGDIYYKKDSDSDYTWSQGISSNSLSSSFQISNLNPEQAYTVKAVMYTGYGNITSTIKLQSLSVTMDFRKGGTGVAIGGVSIEDGFDVYMASKFMNTVNMLKSLSVTGSISATTSVTAPKITTSGISSSTNSSSYQYDFTNNFSGTNTLVDNIAIGKFMDGYGDVQSGLLYSYSFVDYNNQTDNQCVHYVRFGNMVTLSGIITPSATIQSNTSALIAKLPGGLVPVQGAAAMMQGTGTNIWTALVQRDGQFVLQRYRNGTTYGSCTQGTWLPFSISYSLI